MAEKTGIVWCKSTWSPWEGCTKVSAECQHCYADVRDARMHAKNRHWGPKNPRKPMSAAYWKNPIKWNKEAAITGELWTVFPSLCDPFDDHPSITPEWRAAFWNLIRMTPHLTWIILTKRPENAARLLPADWGDGYANVWLLVSAGTQATADERIPILMNTPATVRGVSLEPQLEYVSLRQWPDLDYVIQGCESGPNRRPFIEYWARDTCDHCIETDTAYCLKQTPGDGPRGVNDAPTLDGRTWNQRPRSVTSPQNTENQEQN